jgi:hypothetical protein
MIVFEKFGQHQPLNRQSERYALEGVPIALSTMADALGSVFLQSRRLKAAGRKKRVGGPPPQPSVPAIRQAILDLFARAPPRRCPHCEKLLADTVELKLPK